MKKKSEQDFRKKRIMYIYGVWSETPVSDGQDNVGEVTMRVIGRGESPCFLMWHARGQ